MGDEACAVARSCGGARAGEQQPGQESQTGSQGSTHPRSVPGYGWLPSISALSRSPGRSACCRSLRPASSGGRACRRGRRRPGPGPARGPGPWGERPGRGRRALVDGEGGGPDGEGNEQGDGGGEGASALLFEGEGRLARAPGREGAGDIRRRHRSVPCRHSSSNWADQAEVSSSWMRVAPGEIGLELGVAVHGEAHVVDLELVVGARALAVAGALLAVDGLIAAADEGAAGPARAQAWRTTSTVHRSPEVTGALPRYRRRGRCERRGRGGRR